MTDNERDSLHFAWRESTRKFLESLHNLQLLESEQHGQNALRIARSHESFRGEPLIMSLLNLASARDQAGDLDGAEQLFLEAIMHSKESPHQDAVLLGNLYISWSQCLDARGKHKEAYEYLQEGVRLLVGSEDPDCKMSASRALCAMGNACRDRNLLSDAEECFRSAIEILETSHGPSSLELCHVYSFLADIYARTGDRASAVYFIGTALNRAHDLVGDLHPIAPQLLTRSAKNQSRFGNRTEALESLTIAYSLWGHLGLSHHPECLETLIEFGGAQLAAGNVLEAKWCFVEVLESLKKCGNDVSALAARAWRGRCWVERELKNAPAEYDCARTVCTIIRQVAGTDAPCLVGDFTAVGEAILRLSNPDLKLAFGVFNEALNRAKSIRGDSDAALLPPLCGLAATLERLGYREAHEEILDEIKRLRELFGLK